MELAVALAALVVTALALLRDRLEHRQNRAAERLALTFTRSPSPFVNQRNDEPPFKEYRLLVRAAGPGTYYNVRTHLWVGDEIEGKWKGESRKAARFDNTSDPLEVTIEVLDRDAEKVWFGVGYVESSASHLSERRVQTQYGRTNIVSGEVQVWRWYRTTRLRLWWQYLDRGPFGGKGKPRRLGRWKTLRLRPPLARQFPTWDGVAEG